MSSDEPKAGYGRPPKQHQFKKGQSGNPRGRPKKSQNRRTVLVQSLGDLVLAEAARPISVREGDVPVEMTVQEAFVRTMAAKAMKGDRVFAKLFQQLISSAQKDKAEQRQQLFEAACEYKWDWEVELAICRRKGLLPFFEPLPHPDDIKINPRTGEVTIAGPMCAEEKELMDRRIEDRDGAIALLENPGEMDDFTPEERQGVRAMLIEDIDRINALLPLRLRRTYDGTI